MCLVLTELQILQRKSSACHHTAAVTGAGVSGSGAEVGASISTGREHRLVCAELVHGSVLHAHGHDSVALSVVHQQVGGEVLDEEDGVVLERLAVQSVQHGVTSAISGSGASVGLASSSILQRLTTEGALVDLALVRARERQTVALQLQHSGRSLAAHVVDRILVTEPIGALDGIVCMPSPVILQGRSNTQTSTSERTLPLQPRTRSRRTSSLHVSALAADLGHVSEGGVDSTLRSDRVRSRGEQLADACHLESLRRQAECSAQTSTAGAHHDRVVLVLNDRVCLRARHLNTHADTNHHTRQMGAHTEADARTSEFCRSAPDSPGERRLNERMCLSTSRAARCCSLLLRVHTFPAVGFDWLCTAMRGLATWKDLLAAAAWLV